MSLVTAIKQLKSDDKFSELHSVKLIANSDSQMGMHGSLYICIHIFKCTEKLVNAW